MARQRDLWNYWVTPSWSSECHHKYWMVVKNENGRNQEINRNEKVRDTDVIVGTPSLSLRSPFIKVGEGGSDLPKIETKFVENRTGKSFFFSKDSKETCP